MFAISLSSSTRDLFLSRSRDIFLNNLWLFIASSQQGSEPWTRHITFSPTKRQLFGLEIKFKFNILSRNFRIMETNFERNCITHVGPLARSDPVAEAFEWLFNVPKKVFCMFGSAAVIYRSSISSLSHCTALSWSIGERSEREAVKTFLSRI